MKVNKYGSGRLNNLMKKYIGLFVLFFLVSIINITVFTLSYNSLVTPYLTEPQRVLNANGILMVVFPAYILSALLTVFLSVVLTKKLHRH